MPKQLKGFLGVPRYYQNFIKGDTFISYSLKALLKKGTGWECTSEQQEVFDALKQKIVHPPIYAF